MTKTNAQTKTVAAAAKTDALSKARQVAADAAKKAGHPDKVVALVAKGRKVITAEDLGGAAAKPKLSNGDKPKAQLARGINAKDAQQSAKAVADQNKGQPKATNKADAATQKPKSPKVDKASAKAEKLAKDDARKITFVAENPKRPGSASFDRFAKYKKGMTVAQAIAAGVTRADIDWDSKRDFIKFA